MIDLLFSFDHLLFIWINHLPHTPIVDMLAAGLWGFGAAGVMWALVVLQLLILEKDRVYTMIYTVIGTLGAYIASEVLLKGVFTRPRPEEVIPGTISVISGSVSMYSFPSTHATVVFAWAYILSRRYPIFRLFHIGFATTISFLRVYMGVHFPADVVYGALVGTLIGYLVIRLSEIKVHVQGTV